MNRSIIAAAIIAAASLPFAISVVAAEQEPRGKVLATEYFAAMDTNSDSHLSVSEYIQQKKQEFASMDGDDNRILSWDEFKSFSFGMETIAQEKRRMAGYKVARRILFDLMDRDNNWWLTEREQENGFIRDHMLADENDDGLLSESEFLWNSMYSITLRSALGKSL